MKVCKAATICALCRWAHGAGWVPPVGPALAGGARQRPGEARPTRVVPARRNQWRHHHNRIARLQGHRHVLVKMGCDVRQARTMARGTQCRRVLVLAHNAYRAGLGRRCGGRHIRVRLCEYCPASWRRGARGCWRRPDCSGCGRLGGPDCSRNRCPASCCVARWPPGCCGCGRLTGQPCGGCCPVCRCAAGGLRLSVLRLLSEKAIMRLRS